MEQFHNMTCHFLQDSAKQYSELQAAQQQKEAECIAKEAALAAQLAEEKRECQNARDLLIRAQKDIENLRQGQSNEVSKWTRDLESKDKEAERLKMLIHTLEKKLKDAEAQSHDALEELKRSSSLQQKDLLQLQEEYRESQKLKEQITLKYRQLENEFRLLKKEYSRKDTSRNSNHPEYTEVPSATFLVSEQGEFTQ